MKNESGNDKWYLVAALIVLLEIGNIYIVSNVLDSMASMLISMLLCLIFFIFVGQTMAKCHQAKEKEFQEWKQAMEDNQARLVSDLSKLRQELGDTRTSVDTSLAAAKSQMIGDVEKLSKDLKTSVQDQMAKNADSQAKLQLVVSSGLEKLTHDAKAALQASAGSMQGILANTAMAVKRALDENAASMQSVIDNGNTQMKNIAQSNSTQIKALIEANSDHVAALERSVATIAPRLSNDIMGMGENLSAEISEKTNMSGLYSYVASELAAMRAVIRDNHISQLNVMNGNQSDTTKLIVDTQAETMRRIGAEANAVRAVSRDNHISMLGILNGNQADTMKGFASDFKAMSAVMKDNHISTLSIINGNQTDLTKLIADKQKETADTINAESKAVRAMTKDNHISSMMAIAEKTDNIANIIKEENAADRNIAKDNHLSTLSIINGNHNETAATIRENCNKEVIEAMSAKVDSLMAASSKLASDVAESLTKFNQAGAKGLKEVSQSIGAQSFRSEMVLEGLNQLSQTAADNGQNLMARCADIELQLASLRGVITALNRVAKADEAEAETVEAAPAMNEVYSEAGEEHTESYTDPTTGLTLKKYYSNDILVCSEMTDGDHVKYDVNYNEDGTMASSHNYNKAGQVVLEFTYHKNGKVATRTAYTEKDGARSKQISVFDEHGKRIN